MKKTGKRLLIAALAALATGAARAQEVVAVLGSDQRPYREAYEGLQAAFGGPVPLVPIDEEVPEGAKIVLAFGGKAAVQRYPARVTLIYGIAPGISMDRKARDGASIKIMMEPEAGPLLRSLAAIQPKLKRLAVLWASPSQAGSVDRLGKAGSARGVTVVSERISDAGELPAKLRDLKGKVDAIWLPPDPLLISARNFAIIKSFSYDNRVPFYVPTAGLAEQGATAAVSVSYEEIGRAMAGVAKSALAGASSPAEVYAARHRVTVNLAAASEAELAVPAEALATADKVLP